jgi:jumonji domain-containing protein 7
MKAIFYFFICCGERALLATWNDEFLAAASSCLQDSGRLVLKLDSSTTWVPWVSVEPFPKDSDLQIAKSQFPRYFEGPPAFECTVRAGELLYL